MNGQIEFALLRLEIEPRRPSLDSYTHHGRRLVCVYILTFPVATQDVSCMVEEFHHSEAQDVSCMVEEFHHSEAQESSCITVYFLSCKTIPV